MEPRVMRLVAPRTNTYDAIRLFAALSVVVGHASIHLRQQFLWLEPGGFWWFYDGVPAFFIISGMFVFGSADRLRAAGRLRSDFYWNRFLRVVPAIWAYIAVVAVAAAVLGIVTLREMVSATGAAWLGSGLLMAPIYSPPMFEDFGVGHLNGSLWTIPVEVSFYVVVPLLVLAAARYGARRFLPVLMILAGVFGLAGEALGETLIGKLLGITFLPHLWFFAIGIMWFFLRQRMDTTATFALSATLGYIACTLSRLYAGGLADHAIRMLGAVCLSYVIVHVGDHGPSYLRRFTDRLGDLSYGVYIWHMIVVNAFLWYAVPARLPERGWLVMSVVVAASTAIAWLSWRLVERPALRLKRRTSRAAALPGAETISV